MKFLALQPFVPSGAAFDRSKEFFQQLGFHVGWHEGDYIGFERDGCRFILQRYDNDEFARNLMLTVRVDDVAAFLEDLLQRNIPETFGVKISNIQEQPYGKEVNIIDLAGVCWHFVE